MAIFNTTGARMSRSGEALPFNTGDASIVALVRSQSGVVTNRRVWGQLRNTGGNAFVQLMCCGVNSGSAAGAGAYEAFFRHNNTPNETDELVTSGSIASPDLGLSMVEFHKTGINHTLRVNRGRESFVYTQAQPFTFNEINVGGHHSSNAFLSLHEIVDFCVYSGNPSEAELDAFWNAGVPLLGQQATIVQTATTWAYWPLTADGNDISGNARNLTTIGTVTYGDVSDITTPRVTARESYGHEIIAFGATQTERSFRLLLPDRFSNVSVGLEAATSARDQVIELITNNRRETVQLNDLEVDDRDNTAVFEHPGVFTEGALDRSRVIRGVVRMPSAGVVRRAIVRWGPGAPCNAYYPWYGPTAVRLGNAIEFYGASQGRGAKVRFRLGGDPVEIDTDATRRGGAAGINDHNHLGVAAVVFSTAAGDSADLVGACYPAGHSDPGFYFVAETYTGESFNAGGLSAPVTISSGAKFTYAQAVKSGNTANRMFCMTRGNGGNTETATLARISDVHSTPATRLDVIAPQDPTYPVAVVAAEDGAGETVYVAAMSLRDDTKADNESLHVATYKESADRWYTPNNTPSGASAGTPTTARFTESQFTTAAASNGCSLLGAAGTRIQHYPAETLLVDARDMPGTLQVGTGMVKLWLPYIYSDQSDEVNFEDAPTSFNQDVYAPAEFRIRVWKDGVASDLAGIPQEIVQGPGTAYRMNAWLDWKDGSPATNTAYGMFPIRGRKHALRPSDDGGGALPTGQYLDFGCDSCVLYKITGPFSALPVWERVAQFDANDGVRFASVESISGATNTVALYEAHGQIRAHASLVPRVIDIAAAVADADAQLSQADVQTAVTAAVGTQLTTIQTAAEGAQGSAAAAATAASSADGGAQAALTAASGINTKLGPPVNGSIAADIAAIQAGESPLSQLRARASIACVGNLVEVTPAATVGNNDRAYIVVRSYTDGADKRSVWSRSTTPWAFKSITSPASLSEEEVFTISPVSTDGGPVSVELSTMGQGSPTALPAGTYLVQAADDELGSNIYAELLVDWDGTTPSEIVRADVAATKAAVEASSVAAVDAERIAASRTWHIGRRGQHHSDDIVKVFAGFDGTLQFSLARGLNPGTTINNVATVTIGDGTQAASNLRLTTDRMSVLFDTPALVAGDVGVVCIVNTNDAQAIPFKGDLRVV